MSNLIDPIDTINAAPAGSAVYGHVAFDAGAMQTAILIRENDATIKALGQSPKITLKFATFEIGKVSAGFLLLKAGGELYETVWNYHQRGNLGVMHFDEMSTQDMLPILFFGDAKARKPARSIQVKNRLQRDFANAKARCEALPAWSMQEFNAARDVVYQRLPEVADLWRAIS